MSTADPVPVSSVPSGVAAPAAAQTADPALPYEKVTCPFCCFITGRTNRPSREVGRTITACFTCYDTYILTRERSWRGSLADLSAFLRRARANYEAEKDEIMEAHLETKECYCGYADPGFPGDSRCFPCQAKARRAEIEHKRKVRLQSQMEDGNPAKIFSEAEIADMSVQDKDGFNRVLLRDIRRLRGLF